MMRRLVERQSRHPAASTRWRASWRVIIFLPSPMSRAPFFGACRYLARRNPAMRDSARFFHFGFTVALRLAFSARPAAVEAVAKSKGDLALVSAHFEPHARGGFALEAHDAPKIIRAATLHRTRPTIRRPCRYS